MATLAQPAATRDQSFWQKMALGIALFIIFGFAQFAARGLTNYAEAPWVLHLHGVVMLGWLSFTVVQPFLVQRGNLALHRRIGWFAVTFAAGVVGVGSYLGILAVQMGAQPFFFTPPYFLALTQFSLLGFAGLVAAAVIYRRQTEWHRRLMLGSTVLIMEPALGRLLPMPLIMPWGGWVAVAIQLGVMAIILRHDRKVLGQAHPATVAAMLVILTAHVVVEVLAVTPAWQALTASMIIR